MTTEKPKRKRRGKYKGVDQKSRVEDALGSFSDISELGDEMQSWVDGASGTGLEGTTRTQMAGEAADTLTGKHDELEYQVGEVITKTKEFAPTLLEEEIMIVLQLPRSKRQSPSRAIRLSNAMAFVTVAAEHLDTRINEIRTLIENGEEHLFFPDIDETGFTPEMKEQVLEEMHEIQADIEQIQEHASELEGVEFPGMYG